MADLIAQGREPQQRWRRELPCGDTFVLGRTAGEWATPWDDQVSRQHVELEYEAEDLRVRRLPTGRNPIFYRGNATDEFTLRPGEHFVIGHTRFTFTLEEAPVAQDVDVPLEEQSFSSQYLRGVRFHNADHRIDVLSRLPEVISGAEKDEQLFVRLVNMLMAGIPRAHAVALVVASRDESDSTPVRVLHWDHRLTTGGGFQPSRRLIVETLNRQASVLHVWGAGGSSARRAAEFTVSDSHDWAFCTPVPGRACQGWAFYVAGRHTSPQPATPRVEDPGDLREDLKFTEIVAATLSSLRQLGGLQRKQAMLSQFFPPAVLNALDARGADDVLAPDLTRVSVLFCDLRGFSRQAEQDAEDLMGLLERVSQALGVMTHHILEQGGVVGDFQGDAAMGFWGWPLSDESDIERACLAALAIRRQFEATSSETDHPLAGFRVGIGLATGTAVAGGIGTKDQLQKFTVFGPVVNLASRLEGLTKQTYASILIDETTARAVRDQISPELARCRRVAEVKPYGLDTPLEISELLLPAEENPELTGENIGVYEQALDAFNAGDWTGAMKLLHDVPVDDRVKDFLTEIILTNKRTPPPNWQGVIEISSKG